MIVLHPSTAATIDAYGQQIPHGLIIAGPVGVGLSGAAETIVTQLRAVRLLVQPMKNDVVDTEKGVITVESVRNLYEITKTRPHKTRVVVIDFAERMGVPAQNAFLKLLEEPPANTHFFLLTHAPEELLPTIRSRSQRLDVQSVSLQQSESLLDSMKVFDATKRTQLLFIAAGLPAALTRLVQDDGVFAARAQLVRDARMLVQGRRYEVLQVAQRYKEDRIAALTVIEDAMKLLRRSVSQGGDQSIHKIERLLEVYERIRANGNIRLQLAASVV